MFLSSCHRISGDFVFIIFDQSHWWFTVWFGAVPVSQSHLAILKIHLAIVTSTSLTYLLRSWRFIICHSRRGPLWFPIESNISKNNLRLRRVLAQGNTSPLNRATLQHMYIFTGSALPTVQLLVHKTESSNTASKHVSLITERLNGQAGHCYWWESSIGSMAYEDLRLMFNEGSFTLFEFTVMLIERLSTE